MLPPVIQTHPGDAGVFPGGTIRLSVVATGRNLVYQWYRVVDGGPDIALTDTQNIFGSDTDTLIITEASEDQEAVYYCIVSNDAMDVESNRATVTVREFSGMQPYKFLCTSV